MTMINERRRQALDELRKAHNRVRGAITAHERLDAEDAMISLVMSVFDDDRYSLFHEEKSNDDEV